MAVDSVGTTLPAQVMARTAVVQPSEKPVIDAQTIKTILYLGMKGDVSSPRSGDPAMAAGQSGGVDTYA